MKERNKTFINGGCNMNSKRIFSFLGLTVLLITHIFFSHACSREKANGENVKNDKDKTANPAQQQEPVLAQQQAQQSKGAGGKPNIIFIMGDDVGWYNVSAYNQGVMGYRTPNIDRIAREGAMFTDWYGQQSCTAGRAAFITGQSPIRTGLTKVGLPGAPEGMKKEDPTIATLLRAQGYVTGQFGKNHLGDRDEMLPTAHGFDEFFGNLYHLNA